MLIVITDTHDGPSLHKEKKRKQQVPTVNAQKEEYAASSRGSRDLKQENLTAPKAIATDLETVRIRNRRATTV